MRKFTTSLLIIAFAFPLLAQEGKEFKKLTKGFEKTETGLYYKITEGEPRGKKVEVDDYIVMTLKYGTQDTSLYDSENSSIPAEMKVGDAVYPSDVMEGILMMHEGDEAQFISSVDSFFKYAVKAEVPDFLEDKKWLIFDVSIKSTRSYDEMMAEKQAQAAKQRAAEEDKIAQYVNSYFPGIEARTSGLYYIEEKEGTGKQAASGTTVVVHYKGTLLTGETFDSSYDRGEAIEFKLGMGWVIPGWEEGIALMKEGGKATLIIPSRLAYGQNPPPGSIIQAFSPLRFDVELIEVKQE